MPVRPLAIAISMTHTSSFLDALEDTLQNISLILGFGCYLNERHEVLSAS
jgi:hypothetical protein